jgi:hypothetical protein
MALSLAMPAKNVILEIGDTVPPVVPTVWTTIAEVTTINDFPVVREVKDTTYHDASFFRNQTPVLFEAINPTITGNYIQSQYSVFWESMIDVSTTDGALHWWHILYPDGFYKYFAAHITGLITSTPIDDVITYTMNLAVDGEVTYFNT